MDKESQASLQEIVKMAIQITTDQVEADARSIADKEKQEALAKIQFQKADDEKAAESFRRQLYELQNETKVIKQSGVAIAETKAKAEADRIQVDSELEIAEIKAKIQTMTQDQEINYEINKKTTLLNRDIALKNLEIEKEKELSGIETGKFS